MNIDLERTQNYINETTSRARELGERVFADKVRRVGISVIAGLAMSGSVAALSGGFGNNTGMAFQPSRATASEQIPSELGNRISYFDQSADSIRHTASGEVIVSTSLKSHEIQVIFAQDIVVAGNRFTVDPSHNPDSGQVVAILAGNNISNLEYAIEPGVSVWKAKEQTKASAYSDLVADLDLAGKVQVSRSRIIGNCGPRGCTTTRLVELVAHQDTDNQVRYDFVSDTDHSIGG